MKVSKINFEKKEITKNDTYIFKIEPFKLDMGNTYDFEFTVTSLKNEK